MNTKKFSKIQEKRVAKNMGYAKGHTQIASGAVNVAGLKHDVKTEVSNEWDVLVECKTSAIKTGQCGKRSFSIKREWLEDVIHHAFDMGKAMGIVVFSYDNKKDFVAMQNSDFTNLHKAVIDYETELRTIKSENAQNRKIIGYLLSKLGNKVGLTKEECVAMDTFDFVIHYDPESEKMINLCKLQKE